MERSLMVALLAICAGGCGKSQHCFKGDTDACHCWYNTNSASQENEPSTKECSAVGFASGYCCASEGTLCECEAIKCGTTTTECECTIADLYVGPIGSEVHPTDDHCTQTFAHCCVTAEGRSCTCSDNACAGGDIETARCDDASIFKCSTGDQRVDSCGSDGEPPPWTAS